MKPKIGAVGAVFALAAATLGLSAGPAGAASARAHTRVTIERLPVPAPAALTAPDSYTSTCDAAAKSPTFTADTRLDWCADFAVLITVFEGGDPVGTATIDQVDYASWKVSSRTWNPTEQLYAEDGPGTGVLEGEPITVDAASTCSSGCSITSNGSYTVVPPQYPADVQKNVGVDSPGTATVTGQLTTTWTYTGDGLTATPPITETTVGVRCDSIYPGYRYRAGCANPSFTPTYVLSAAKYKDIAKFDKAELTKHPSWSTLTRVSPAQADKNRKIACKGFHPPPPYSCDEFPYASTAQGGKGAAVKKVLLSENTSQGNNLGAFYNANRLFYGEKFHVKIS